MLAGFRLVSEAAEFAARHHNGMHILPQPDRDERDDLIAYVAWAERSSRDARAATRCSTGLSTKPSSLQGARCEH